LIGVGVSVGFMSVFWLVITAPHPAASIPLPSRQGVSCSKGRGC
jgi:hypothetical protein